MGWGAPFNLVLIKVQEVKQRRSPTYLQAGATRRCSLEAISTSGLTGWIFNIYRVHRAHNGMSASRTKNLLSAKKAAVHFHCL